MKYLLFILASFGIFAQPYNGTASGSLTYTTGAHGQGLQGTSPSGANVQVPAGATNWAGDFSVTWKMKIDSTVGYQALWDFGGASCQAFGFTGKLYCKIGGTNIDSTGGSAHNVADGSFHSGELRRSGTTATIWVDGVQMFSGTVGSGNLGNGSAGTLLIESGGTQMPTTSVLDEVAIWKTASPTSCGPCVGSETDLWVLYHLDNNLNDSKGAAGLTAGALTNCTGLCLAVAMGGTSPYQYQLQKGAIVSGSCSGASFSNDGSALTGQTSSATFARTDTASQCWRVVVTDAAAATANSNSLIAPTNGGTRSF